MLGAELEDRYCYEVSVLGEKCYAGSRFLTPSNRWISEVPLLRVSMDWHIEMNNEVSTSKGLYL